MTVWNDSNSCNRLAQQTADMRERARQRAALNTLVRRVIRNELNEQERLLVRLHWYQGKSKEEIASLTGLERSVVYRRLDKIGKTVYDHLKYAVEFRFDEPAAEEAKRTLKLAGQNTFALEALNGIGARLTAARKRKRLSLENTARAAGIPPSRMRTLENDGRQMMMTELSALTGVLGVGVNELLFGSSAEEMAQ